ncbi:unnamed protein product [Phaedon cochleariae]|uniref:Uncharacterized protein n=1 Tax=Phaedon cochleariae TaxID=80249 RepID=A0A9N9SLM2_PHACE|nr:unnamed protein product [Phaedon cochleariae]
MALVSVPVLDFGGAMGLSAPGGRGKEKRGKASSNTVLGPTVVSLGVEADSAPPRDQSLPSPAPSPYPAAQAETREDEMPPEQNIELEPRPASQCFPTELQQQQQQVYQQYARAPPPAAPPPVPPHMLGAGSFSALQYLKQPGVMLTSLGPEVNGQLDQYASNMQDLRAAALPDVIQQQHVGLKKGATGMNGELRYV